MKEYALYRGENLLAMGTIAEISKVMGIKPNSVMFYLFPSYGKRTSEKARRLIEVEGDEE